MWRDKVGALTLYAAVYLAAVAVRLPLRDVAPFLDEGGFFYIAAHGLVAPSNLVEINGVPYPWQVRFWFAERPLYYVLMAPWARASFQAFRLVGILMASLVPVAGMALLKAMSVRRWMTLLAGLLVAVFPLFVPWGPIVYMDPPMTLFALVGLWLWSCGRAKWGAAFLAASAWIKPLSLPAFAAILVLDVVRLPRTSLRPWLVLAWGRVGIPAAFFAAAWLPTVWVKLAGGYIAGAGELVQDPRQVLELSFGTAWALPFVVAGLFIARLRRLAVAALASGAFVVLVPLVAGRTFFAWWTFLSATLALLTVCALVDELWRPSLAWARARRTGATVALGALLLFSATVVLVPSSPAKDAAIYPWGAAKAESLSEVRLRELDRDQGWADAVRLLSPRSGERFAVIDVYPAHFLYAFVAPGADVTFGFTSYVVPGREQRWNQTLEEPGRVTVLAKGESVLNREIQGRYAACVLLDNPQVLVFAGSHCAGASRPSA